MKAHLFRLGSLALGLCSLATVANQAAAENSRFTANLAELEIEPRELVNGGTVTGRIVLENIDSTDPVSCSVKLSYEPISIGPEKAECWIESLDGTVATFRFSHDFPVNMPDRRVDLHSIDVTSKAGKIWHYSLYETGFDNHFNTRRTVSVSPSEITSITITVPGGEPRVITQQGEQSPILVKRGDAVSLTITGKSEALLQNISFDAIYRLPDWTGRGSVQLPAPLFEASHPLAYSSWGSWLLREVAGNYGPEVYAKSEGISYNGTEFIWKGFLIIPTGSLFESIDLPSIFFVNQDWDVGDFETRGTFGDGTLSIVFPD